MAARLIRIILSALPALVAGSCSALPTHTALQELVMELSPSATMLTPPVAVSHLGRDDANNIWLEATGNTVRSGASYGTRTLTYASADKLAADFKGVFNDVQLGAAGGAEASFQGQADLSGLRVLELDTPVPTLVAPLILGLLNRAQQNGKQQELRAHVVEREIGAQNITFVGSSVTSRRIGVSAGLDALGLKVDNAGSEIRLGSAKGDNLTIAQQYRNLSIKCSPQHDSVTGATTTLQGIFSISLENVRLDASDANYTLSVSVPGEEISRQPGKFGQTWHTLARAAGTLIVMQVENVSAGTYRFRAYNLSAQWL